MIDWTCYIHWDVGSLVVGFIYFSLQLPYIFCSASLSFFSRVAEGWSDSLWALLFVVAGGAICFVLWAPGKKQQTKASEIMGSSRTGLRYEEIATYIEIEGARKKDSIRDTQKRLDGA